MNDTQENAGQPTEPLPSTDPDTEETLPPTPVPEEVRARQAAASEPGDRSSGWHQDEIRTPPPLRMPPAATAEPPRRQRPSCLLGFLVGLSLIVGLVSLALSVFLFYSLFNVRQAAISGLDLALDSLENLESQGFHYEYQFSDTLPVQVEIPVQQEMVIPFQGDFPINTTVRVPIDAGVLGTFVLDVPIDTNVPIDVEVPVQISQTVAISTSIPVSMAVPIDVTAEDPAIQGFLDGLRQWLLELRQSFGADAVLPLLGGQ